MDVETESDGVSTIDQAQPRNLAVVKVFIIENAEGNWLDCGAGDVQFTTRHRNSPFVPTALERLAQRDLGIRVISSTEEPQARDFIEPSREMKLRNSSDDKAVLLEVNFEQARDFSKCQCNLLLTSNYHHLGADRLEGEYSPQFP